MIPLKDEQIQIIEHYVNKEKFDVTKMVSYLEKHKVVKNDIFSKCKKCTFRINGAPFPRQRCKRLAPTVRYPFVVTC